MAPTLTELARRLNRGRGAQVALLTDPARQPAPLKLVATLPRGALVILRHYEAPDRIALAVALAALCRRRRLRLIIAADARLAQAVRAAGLHLPEALARRPPPAALAWRHRCRALLTVACHGRAALVRARRLGADAALLSPIFPTASHPGATPLGPLRFARLARRAGLPVLALGGVAAETARRLAGSGAAGLASVSGFGDGAPQA